MKAGIHLVSRAADVRQERREPDAALRPRLGDPLPGQPGLYVAFERLLDGLCKSEPRWRNGGLRARFREKEERRKEFRE
jgi:hypothetical protein